MQDIQRIKHITASYHELQGLRMLPWFLWMLALSAINPLLGLRQGDLSYQCLILVPGVFVAWGASWWIGRYYDRRFGRVHTIHDWRASLFAIAAIAVVFATFFVDSLVQWPVSLTALTVATLLLVAWWLTGRFRNHYLAVAALFAVAAVAIPLIRDSWPRVGAFALPIVMGVLLIFASLLDHLLLIRSLKPLPQEASDDAGI